MRSCCFKTPFCPQELFFRRREVSLSLVLMTLVMGLVSLAQMGVASSCATPFMEDLACSDGLQRLGGFIHRELLETSCGRAELLMCDSVDSMLVSRTLLAAVLGTTVSCCIPRRLLVAWMSAQQSVHTAEARSGARSTLTAQVLADLHRGGKPVPWPVFFPSKAVGASVLKAKPAVSGRIPLVFAGSSGLSSLALSGARVVPGSLTAFHAAERPRGVESWPRGVRCGPEAGGAAGGRADASAGPEGGVSMRGGGRFGARRCLSSRIATRN